MTTSSRPFHRLFGAILAVSLGLVLNAEPVHSATINFDDLSGQGSLPSGYAGPVGCITTLQTARSFNLSQVRRAFMIPATQDPIIAFLASPILFSVALIFPVQPLRLFGSSFTRTGTRSTPHQACQ
jgi:hypothetical protein